MDEEKVVLFCALCKIYDNYVTPLNSSVACWKYQETELTFIAGMTVKQFNGKNRYVTYRIPIKWWPMFNISAVKEPPGIGEIDRKDILLNL